MFLFSQNSKQPNLRKGVDDDTENHVQGDDRDYDEERQIEPNTPPKVRKPRRIVLKPVSSTPTVKQTKLKRRDKALKGKMEEGE
jgi:hypothetical protein